MTTTSTKLVIESPNDKGKSDIPPVEHNKTNELSIPRNLFDGFVPQGISSFIWEPQHEASGLYLITAILNGSIETKKVLFQK